MQLLKGGVALKCMLAVPKECQNNQELELRSTNQCAACCTLLLH
jgi:hypothetical protein